MVDWALQVLARETLHEVWEDHLRLAPLPAPLLAPLAAPLFLLPARPNQQAARGVRGELRFAHGRRGQRALQEDLAPAVDLTAAGGPPAPTNNNIIQASGVHTLGTGNLGGAANRVMVFAIVILRLSW